MKTRVASTRTPAPPATSSATPDGRHCGQAVPDHHQGGCGGGQHREDGRRRRACRPAGPAGPESLGHPPRGHAEQYRRDHRHQLRRDTQVAAQHPLAHGQRVTDGDGEQGQVGQRGPVPGGRDHRQQRAEHGQVRQRVDQGEQEGARPLTRPVELCAEQRGPADHQQRDGHHVAVREPGQDRTRRALRARLILGRAVRPGRGAGTTRLRPVRAVDAAPFGHGQRRGADGQRGQRQQRRQVGEGQAGSRVQRATADPRDDQADAVQRGAGREPPVGPRDGAVIPARAEPQAHRRRAPRQHAEHGHPRRSEMIRRTRAPSVPPRCSEVLNARRAKADSLVTLSLPRRNEKSLSSRRSIRRRPPRVPGPKQRSRNRSGAYSTYPRSHFG